MVDNVLDEVPSPAYTALQEALEEARDEYMAACGMAITAYFERIDAARAVYENARALERA